MPPKGLNNFTHTHTHGSARTHTHTHTTPLNYFVLLSLNLTPDNTCTNYRSNPPFHLISRWHTDSRFGLIILLIGSLKCHFIKHELSSTLSQDNTTVNHYFWLEPVKVSALHLKSKGKENKNTRHKRFWFCIQFMNYYMSRKVITWPLRPRIVLHLPLIWANKTIDKTIVHWPLSA